MNWKPVCCCFLPGKSRSSAAIIEEQKKNTSSGENDAIEAMHKIKQSAKDMKLAIFERRHKRLRGYSPRRLGK